jgi:hypothetical protein
MLEDQSDGEQTCIPVPNVCGRTLKYVIEYTRKPKLAKLPSTISSSTIVALR